MAVIGKSATAPWPLGGRGERGIVHEEVLDEVERGDDADERPVFDDRHVTGSVGDIDQR